MRPAPRPFRDNAHAPADESGWLAKIAITSTLAATFAGKSPVLDRATAGRAR
jgi:hypothetical protein